MIVLALDCSLAACSVALLRQDEILVRASRPIGPGEAELIVPLICEAAASGGVALTDPDLFAVTVGPGSFTGVRVGIAAARGLALAAGKPLVGVSTTEALAAALPHEVCAGRGVLVAIDARRSEVYAQAFSSTMIPVSDILCCSVAQARALGPMGNRGTAQRTVSGAAPGWKAEGSILVVGSGAPLVCSGAGPAFIAAGGDPNPDVVVLAKLARERFQGLRAPLAADPLYARRPSLVKHAAST
jgi:tRNA threonylcarbamoyladenosine biosynthesis protein TsaB